MNTPILLASSSVYRQSLLSKIVPNFDTASPDINENALPHETPQQLVQRLSEQKAQALRCEYPQHLIIGSDQLAYVRDQQPAKILGKPITQQKAAEQLAHCSGNTVRFLTGVCVNMPQHSPVYQLDVTDVVFKQLTAAQIDYYINKEDVLSCAGSFKVEGLGIALFEKVISEDPNALIGLPLIQLLNIFEQLNIDVLSTD